MKFEDALDLVVKSKKKVTRTSWKGFAYVRKKGEWLIYCWSNDDRVFSRMRLTDVEIFNDDMLHDDWELFKSRKKSDKNECKN